MDALVRLFSAYSLLDIIIILTLGAMAVMGIGRFIEWGYSYLKKYTSKKNRNFIKENELNERLKKIEMKADYTEKSIKKLNESTNSISSTLTALVESDKDNIRAYLLDKHHFFVYEQKWIDDFNLECLERRYGNYKKFGGNSFIDHYMDELRELPNQPPVKIE